MTRNPSIHQLDNSMQEAAATLQSKNQYGFNVPDLDTKNV